MKSRKKGEIEIMCRVAEATIIFIIDLILCFIKGVRMSRLASEGNLLRGCNMSQNINYIKKTEYSL
jgi:hypothetical protein